MTLFEITRNMRDFLVRAIPDRSIEDHWASAKKIVQHGYGLTPLGWACALSDHKLAAHPMAWADFQAVWGAACIRDVPLSRLFGYGWFCGRRFDLNEATLDPRWESEGIIALVGQYGLENSWCDDLGVGCSAMGSGMASDMGSAMGSDMGSGMAPGMTSDMAPDMGSDMLSGMASDMAPGMTRVSDAGAAGPGAGDSGVRFQGAAGSERFHPEAKSFTGGSQRPRILDVGTGSGCLLITLLMHFKGALGCGLDYSVQALNAARLNGQRHGVADRVQWIHSDGLSCFNAPWEQSHGGFQAVLEPECPKDPVFDIIVSNPPYVSCDAALPDDVRQWDPPLALYAGKDGLDAYRAWIGPMAQHLALGGVLVLEIGWDQGPAVQDLCAAAGFSNPRIVTDDDGKNRYVWAIKDGLPPGACCSST